MSFRKWIKRPKHRAGRGLRPRDHPRFSSARVPMVRASVVALLLSGAPAFAQSFQDQYVAQLRQQGFEQITVRHTLLGRVRIVALSDEYRREIVFLPDNGTILRDYWAELSGDDDEGDDENYILFDPNGGSGEGDGNHGSGGGNDDDDDDDDEDDDDDDDDEDDDDEDDDEDDDDDDEDDED